ncbi:MAG: EamA family transporter [Pseudomonadota bacterium]|nr:EamA family transporter [Pseudomonadota bacterium]
MLGGILALFAAATFGLNSVAIRRGVLSGSVAQGLSISIPIAVPIFLLMALFTGALDLFSTLSLKSVLLLSFAGIIHFIFGRYANYRATKAMGANLVGPVISSSMILTLILAIIFLKEVMTPLRIIGIAMVVLGPAFMLKSPEVLGKKNSEIAKEFTPKLLEGYLFATLCAIAFGTTPIMLRSAFLDIEGSSIISGILGGLVSYVSATLVLCVYLTKKKNWVHAMSIDREAAKWFTLTGLFVCVSHLFRFMALAIAPVSVVSPIIQSSGIFRTIFGWFINRNYEVFDFWIILGTLTTILGAVLLTLSVEDLFEMSALPSFVSDFLLLRWP